LLNILDLLGKLLTVFTMKRFQPFFGCLAVILWAPLSALAEAESDGTEPPLHALFERDPVEELPASLILDKARLFNERENAQLSARLKKFKAAHKISIYVAAYSVLIGETIDERAKRLKEKWLADERGIVLAYQRGTEKMSFSSTADPENYVSRSELEQIFAEAYGQAAVQDRGSNRVIAACNRLMSDLPASILAQDGNNAMSSSETRKFVTWSLAALVLLTVGGMFAFHFLRRSQLRVTKTYSFPMLKVPERFGAAYCGGHQAEIEFTVPSA
jgi:uncharacterized membrane protein YgcG